MMKEVLELVLKNLGDWRTLADVEETVGKEQAQKIVNDILEKKFIKCCGCGCGGFMITEKGIAYLEPKDTTAKHTPGPWFIEKESWLKGHTSVGSKSHGAMIQVIAEMDWDGTKKEKNMSNPVYARWVEKNKTLQANARLVAEAPELLELVRTANGSNGCHTVMWQEKAKQILTKISGE